MDTLPSIFPVTVIAAVVLFFVKEGVEFYRRMGGEKRKKKAFKKLFSRECELNHWVLKSLRAAVEDIRQELEKKSGASFHIYPRPDGSYGLRILDKHEQLKSGSVIPEPKRDLMEKGLLEIATSDEELFNVLERGYDTVAELTHLRNSLFEYIEEDDDMDYLGGFVDFYAVQVLNDSYENLDSLYFNCTGQHLKDHRLR